MLNQLQKRMDEQSETFNKKLKKYEEEAELNNTITKHLLKIPQKESIIDQITEKWLSELEDRLVESTQVEQKKDEIILKIEESLRDLWETS